MDFFNYYKNEVYLQRSECQLFYLNFLSEKWHYKLLKLSLNLTIAQECVHATIVSGQEMLLKSQKIYIVWNPTTCQKFDKTNMRWLQCFQVNSGDSIYITDPLNYVAKQTNKTDVFLLWDRMQRIYNETAFKNNYFSMVIKFNFLRFSNCTNGLLFLSAWHAFSLFLAITTLLFFAKLIQVNLAPIHLVLREGKSLIPSQTDLQWKAQGQAHDLFWTRESAQDSEITGKRN